VEDSELGSEWAGVWTRQQAVASLGRARVATRLRQGYWQEPYPGVCTDGGTVPDPEQRAWAAVLVAGEGACAAGRTAARLHGLPLIDDDDPATGALDLVHDDVLASRSRTVRGNPLALPYDVAFARGGSADTALVLHQRRGSLDPDERTLTASGLHVTTPARTLFDCAALLTHDALVCAIDNALHRELVTVAQLNELAQRHRWMPGAPAFRAALAVADGRAESPAETLTRLLLLPHLPGLVPQVELRQGGARFDLADEAARFAVEADGRRGHAGEVMAAKDQRRDRRTTGLGWRTERTRWFELRRQQAALVTRMVAAYAEHTRHRAA
jgi:very-short-patch-repair endonuclease